MVEPFVSFRVSRAQCQACLSMTEVEKVRRKSSLRLSRARRVHEHLETLCALDKAARRRPVGKKAGCDRAFRFWEFVSLRFLFWFIILCRVLPDLYKTSPGRYSFFVCFVWENSSSAHWYKTEKSSSWGLKQKSACW